MQQAFTLDISFVHPAGAQSFRDLTEKPHILPLINLAHHEVEGVTKPLFGAASAFLRSEFMLAYDFIRSCPDRHILSKFFGLIFRISALDKFFINCLLNQQGNHGALLFWHFQPFPKTCIGKNTSGQML